MQLELDEDIEIGSIPLIDFNGNTHEMRVSLICYKDKRYVAISRAHRCTKDKTTGKEKIIHRNSIWIPISQIDRVIKLLMLASQKLQSYLPPIPKELQGIPEDIARDIMAKAAEKTAGTSQHMESEDEYLKRNSISVREDARLFLEEAAESLENAISLIIKTKDIADRVDFMGMRVLRVIDYLEDAGYIKVVDEKEVKSNVEKLNHPLPKMNSYTVDQIERFVYERVLQISGLTKEEVEIIDYLEDDDPRISIWNYSKKFAEFEVMDSINRNNFFHFFKITAAGYDWLEDE